MCIYRLYYYKKYILHHADKTIHSMYYIKFCILESVIYVIM